MRTIPIPGRKPDGPHSGPDSIFPRSLSSCRMLIFRGSRASFDNQAQIRNDIYVVASNWFVNRCPLVTRIPRVPVGSTTFTIVSRTFRTRIATLAGAVAATDTQITLVDASPFMNGDVLELASGERVEIVADPNLVDQHDHGPPRGRRDHARHGRRRTTRSA